VALDVSVQALERLLREGEGEVVLVNLIRLRGGGEEAYKRYQAGVAPIAARYGATVIFAGPGVGTLIGDDSWDVGVVTRYPSRQALAGLVNDPEFLELTELRHQALEGGVLYAFA
jgi:uncharacterized protein (DUF1330 family)